MAKAIVSDFGTEPIGKLLVRQAVPAAIGILVMSLNILIDTIFVVTKRVLLGNSPFVADKSHIHHILISKGYTHVQSLLVITGTTGIIQLILLRYITS